MVLHHRLPLLMLLVPLAIPMMPATAAATAAAVQPHCRTATTNYNLAVHVQTALQAAVMLEGAGATWAAATNAALRCCFRLQHCMCCLCGSDHRLGHTPCQRWPTAAPSSCCCRRVTAVAVVTQTAAATAITTTTTTAALSTSNRQHILYVVQLLSQVPHLPVQNADC